MKREKIVAAAPLIIFGLLVLILAAALHHGTPVSKFAQHVGDPAPSTNLAVLGQADTRFTTSSWRGRPYIVNFFASWCVDCRAEHEELMTLAAGKLPIIGITFKDTADKADAYLNRNGDPYIAVALDNDGRAGIDWGLTGVPETFVIDAKGVIRWHYIGGIADDVARDELMPVWETVQRGG